MLAAILSPPEVVTLLGWILATCLVGLVAGCDCCTDCTIYSDDFSVDYLTGNVHWQTGTGTASVTGGAMVVTAADTLVYLLDGNPDSIVPAKIVVHVKGSDGDKARIRIGDDGSYYHCAEITFGTNGAIKIFKNDGVEYCIAGSPLSTSPSTYYEVSVVLSDDTIEVTCNSVTTTVCTSDPTSGNGIYAALGSGDVCSSVSFDNFDFQFYFSGTRGSCALISTWDCCGNVIGFDDCTRSDSSNAGGLWTSAAGTDSLSSNKIALTASNSISLFAPTNPDSGSLYVTAVVSGANSDDEVELICNYIDSSNYYFAKLTIGTTKTIRLYSVVSGSSSLLTSTGLSTSAGSSYTFALCFDGRTISASANGTTIRYYASGASTTAGAKVGIACGTITSQVTFDDITLYRRSDDVHSGGYCVGCGPICGENYPLCNEGTQPSSLIVTISGMANGYCTSCSGLNGTYVCDYDSAQSDGNYCFWVYSFGSAVCSGLGDFQYLLVKMGYYAGTKMVIGVYLIEFKTSGNGHWWGPAIASLPTYPQNCSEVITSLTYDQVGDNGTPNFCSGGTCTVAYS